MYKVKGGASCSARKRILGSGVPTGSGAAQAQVSKKNTKNQHPKDHGCPLQSDSRYHGVLERSSLALGAVSWSCKSLFSLVTPSGSPSLPSLRERHHHFLQIQHQLRKWSNRIISSSKLRTLRFSNPNGKPTSLELW